MVTGIEAAGLALGLFPLVIEGIKFYISSAEKFKEMKHHKRTLDKFRREVVMEKSKFDNTWYTLVSRAGVCIEPNMEFPPETVKEVLSCLPQYAVESFIDGCQELSTILGKLREIFQKYEQNKAGYLKMFGMLRDFIMEDREQYIERIHRLNINLDKLVNGAPPTVAVEANKLKKVNVARHYQQARKHAIILYGALKERLQISSCPCKMSHSANLQLDVCIPENSHNSHVPRMERRLCLLFPVPAEQAKTEEYLTLRELEFENLKNPDSVESESDKTIPKIDIRDLSSGPLLCTTHQTQSDTAYTANEQRPEFRSIISTLRVVSSKIRDRSPFNKSQRKVGFCIPAAETQVKSSPASNIPELIIECFCSTIRNITGVHTCVGTLVSNDSKHRVWAPRAPLAMLTSARVVSLAELLSLPKPLWRERLKLGMRLASSVLQLYKTEWLQERWGKQDIYLIQGASQSRSPSLETPVVCQAFPPEPSVFKASIRSHITRCNLSLFSLGIVLIELWFWRGIESFEDKSQPYYSSSEETSDTARYHTAQRLIDELYGDVGVNYGDVVRRCIIGLDHKEIQLENDGFKNEAYLKVLQPLREDLERFCNETLAQIFEKPDS